MANWINLKEILGKEFYLADINSRPVFKIWDNTISKFLKGKDQIQDKNGKRHNVDTVEKYPFASIKDLFPGCSPKRGAVWEIVYNGDTNLVELPQKASKQIQDFIMTLNELGTDPKSVSFKVNRTGEGINTRYDVKMTSKKGAIIEFSTFQGETAVIETKPGEVTITPKKVFNPDSIKNSIK